MSLSSLATSVEQGRRAADCHYSNVDFAEPDLLHGLELPDGTWPCCPFVLAQIFIGISTESYEVAAFELPRSVWQEMAPDQLAGRAWDIPRSVSLQFVTKGPSGRAGRRNGPRLSGPLVPVLRWPEATGFLR
jgi:hypothetical protein